MAYARTGTHIIADLHGCRSNFNEHLLLEVLMADACRQAGLNVIDTIGKTLSGPQGTGATVVVLLSESRASAHTWPELNYAAVDVSGCGAPEKVWRAFHNICTLFEPISMSLRQVKRHAEV